MHFNNDSDLYRTIGSNIKHYRQQANLTQMQLAEKAQISISYLSKIEASGCDKVFPYLYLIRLQMYSMLKSMTFLMRMRQMPRQTNRFCGGSNTNRNGLHFEQATSLNTALPYDVRSFSVVSLLSQSNTLHYLIWYRILFP